MIDKLAKDIATSSIGLKLLLELFPSGTHGEHRAFVAFFYYIPCECHAYRLLYNISDAVY